MTKRKKHEMSWDDVETAIVRYAQEKGLGIPTDIRVLIEGEEAPTGDLTITFVPVDP
jgi:hypothetical protein